MDTFERGGLAVDARARYAESMGVQAWIQAVGPNAETAQAIEAWLTAAGDPAGLQIRREGDRLMMTHQTAILVYRRREVS